MAQIDRNLFAIGRFRPQLVDAPGHLLSSYHLDGWYMAGHWREFKAEATERLVSRRESSSVAPESRRGCDRMRRERRVRIGSISASSRAVVNGRSAPAAERLYNIC